MEKTIKKILHIRKILTFSYFFLFPLINFFAKFFAKVTSFLYYLLMRLDWGKIPRTEWMDHDQDTYYQFNSNGSFMHFERAILPRLYITNFLTEKEEFKNLKFKKKLNILDLCSGDSYISQKFFFDMSNIIISLDLDPLALARGKNRIKNNTYVNKKHYFYEFDVEKKKKKDLLDENKINIKFDVVLFNAAIEHFKEEQLNFIFLSFKEVMKEKSLVSIYTIIEEESEKKYLPEHHEMFFSSKEHLENIVSKYFKFSKSHHSLFNDRCNIYCIASDQEIKI